MSNQISHLVSEWFSARSKYAWVLAAIYKTEGSAYRKAGALMFINEMGQYHGMISGGCLEADIVRKAQRLMFSEQLETVIYDSRDEDNWSHQMGLGCGGKIYILLQAIRGELANALIQMHTTLKKQQSGHLFLSITRTAAFFKADDIIEKHGHLKKMDDAWWLVTPAKAAPHLLVIGGGRDAQPLVAMADLLGWRITIADPRATHARAHEFPGAKVIIRDIEHKLERYLRHVNVHAAVIMSHNLKIDAAALRVCRDLALKYLALLGPRHRYEEVLQLAGLSAEGFSSEISAPAGIPIGGELPESIALSILAECHRSLMKLHDKTDKMIVHHDDLSLIN